MIQSWPSGGLRLVTDKTTGKKKPQVKQEDLLDLITALVKLNCFLSTTVAKQCTFFYNPVFIIYKFHRVMTHAAVVQWSRRLPPDREVVSSNPVGD